MIAVLTIDQKELLSGNLLCKDSYFHPFELSNGDWAISQEEINNCTSFLFQWVKDLELNNCSWNEDLKKWDLIKKPNWYKLEQDLRYSSLFGKAFQYASDKGFNLFTVTLINGKNGEASENSLAFAFSVLGVDWTDEEKVVLNQILTTNNFTIQI